MPILEQLLVKSIPELRERFVDRARPVPKGLVEALEGDSRQGAHHLAKLIRERWRKNRAEGQRLHNLLRFEIDLWEEGFNMIAGVDEAGMAPLAGPVVAGAVILPKNYKLKKLNDSKQILDGEVRDELAQQIKTDAVVWSVGIAEVEEIDTINIYHAGLLAMRRAVEGLAQPPRSGRCATHPALCDSAARDNQGGHSLGEHCCCFHHRQDDPRCDHDRVRFNSSGI
jgi:ribonuclease HII